MWWTLVSISTDIQNLTNSVHLLALFLCMEDALSHKLHLLDFSQLCF